MSGFTFDQETFPDPSGLITRLQNMGFKVVTIIDPGVKIDPKYKAYRDGLAEDCFVKLPDGELFEAEVWPGRVVFPDFFKEKQELGGRQITRPCLMSESEESGMI